MKLLNWIECYDLNSHCLLIIYKCGSVSFWFRPTPAWQGRTRCPCRSGQGAPARCWCRRGQRDCPASRWTQCTALDTTPGTTGRWGPCGPGRRDVGWRGMRRYLWSRTRPTNHQDAQHGLGQSLGHGVGWSKGTEKSILRVNTEEREVEEEEQNTLNWTSLTSAGKIHDKTGFCSRTSKCNDSSEVTPQPSLSGTLPPGSAIIVYASEGAHSLSPRSCPPRRCQRPPKDLRTNKTGSNLSLRRSTQEQTWCTSTG